MKIIKTLLVMVLCLLLSSPVWAQPAGGQGMGGPGMGQGRGMGPGGGMMRMYNPQTVTTIQGTVESQGPQMGRRMQHVSWVVKTAQGNLTVHLGPAQFLTPMGLTLKPGDTVEVTGSQMTMAKGPMMVAKEVKVGGKTFQLRDDQGVPVWRGQGRRQVQ